MLILMGCLLVLTHCAGAPKKSKFTLDRNPPPPAAGQRYVYQHTGPLPWGDGRKDASGLRTVAVVGQEAPGKNTQWRFEEQFERDEGIQTGYYDKNYMLYKQDLREGRNVLRILYTPPLPVRYLDLPKDREKKYRSRQVFIDPQTNETAGSGDIDIAVRRGYDVRMVTPAGAYLCRHFTERIQITAQAEDTETVMKAVVETFWCDTIGWFVQSDYTFEPMVQNGTVVQPGYQAQSILAGYEPMDPNRLIPLAPEEPDRQERVRKGKKEGP